jgi:broad specificity phosphatase PhoE
VTSTALYLVRHAAQEHAAAGDDPDAGLSETGVRQAHQLVLAAWPVLMLAAIGST